MDTGNVRVRRLEVTRAEVDAAHPTAGPEIAGALKALGVPGGLPLAPERLELELEGVPTAVANALRRVLHDELRGRCLTFEGGDFDREGTTDPFMQDEDFVRTRVRSIPLRPQVPDALARELRFAIDAANGGDTVATVFSGDLVATAGGEALRGGAPLFNPTHELAFLQPGKTLRVRNIRVAEGFGNQDAAFMVALRATARPLDVPELPRPATHSAGGAARHQSGFAESSLVANPRRHLVAATLPAVPREGGGALAVLADACGNVVQRLRYARGVVEGGRARGAAALDGDGEEDGGGGEPSSARSGGFFVMTPDAGRTKAVLGVRGETDTIGNLLARSVFELAPDVAFAAYTCTPHENEMRLTVSNPASEPEEVQALVTRAIDHASGIFTQIQKQVRDRY